MRENNRQINRLRSVVERMIAPVLTWRVLYTGFRRPIALYGQVFSVVRALIFCVAPDSLMNKPFDKESKHFMLSHRVFSVLFIAKDESISLPEFTNIAC